MFNLILVFEKESLQADTWFAIIRSQSKLDKVSKLDKAKGIKKFNGN
jgi:hypothetical protein